MSSFLTNISLLLKALKKRKKICKTYLKTKQKKGNSFLTNISLLLKFSFKSAEKSGVPHKWCNVLCTNCYFNVKNKSCTRSITKQKFYCFWVTFHKKYKKLALQTVLKVLKEILSA